MISRRDIGMMVGVGSLALATGGLTTQATAQTSPEESAFDRVRRTKKMRIGAVAGISPFYEKDLKTGEWGGVYIDLAKELAKELEAELEILETTYGNAVLDLQANKVDLFFGLNPTPKRALVVDFSDSLFSNGYSLITKENFKPKTWLELNDESVKISVDLGSSQDQLLTRLCPNASIVRMSTQSEATVALQTGRVDAQCITFFNILPILKKDPSLGKFLLPTPVMRSDSNIGFRRENDNTLRDFVDTWINFSKGMGLIRTILLANFERIGITEADFPPGVAL